MYAMRHIWQIPVLVGLVVTVVMDGPCRADRFVLALPELEGSAPEFMVSQTEVQFDFGKTFSTVDRLWLELEATRTPAIYSFCGNMNDPPQPCEQRELELGYVATLDDTGSVISSGNVFDGFSDVPSVERVALRPPRLVPTEEGRLIDFLADGRASLSFRWSVPAFFPEDRWAKIADPEGTILRASLILDGTAMVPEPTAIALLFAGLIVLALHGRRRCGRA